MTGFVLFVIFIVALVMALGPVRDRYADRPGANRWDGPDQPDDADRRRLQTELRAAADHDGNRKLPHSA